VGTAKPFSSFRASKRFEAAFRALDKSRRKQAEKAVDLLFNNPAHPGLGAHPIKPDKYFWEAYINTGDRLVYHPDGSLLDLVDIVKHDDIGKSGKAPREGR
jgi:mRNA-degrading endonuclease YafQ of YafQ-DinJ toxin-antitoxin module